MFAPYESIEWVKWVIPQKEIIISKDWFNIVKEWDINKLYLEEYPNNILIENIQDFEILEKNENYTILKIFIDDWYIILDIQETKKDKINKLENIYRNEQWNYEEIEKEKNTINYYIYRKNKIENCNSTYIKWESNTIWKSIWEYTKENIHIKKKYFKKTAKEFLFDLFSK